MVVELPRQAPIYAIPTGAPGARSGRGLPLGLPTSPTPMIGRERESAEVVALLRRDDVRLLTLTGPGGAGKTRLALRVTEELDPNFADGVAYVPLASVPVADAVAATIAQVLDVREDGPSIVDRLRIALRDRAVLLVADNFEHVLAAAPLVVDLLATCPSLKVLVTSRARLRVTGEHAYPVPPLTLPDAGARASVAAVAGSDAVRLFVARARAVDPSFALADAEATTVAELCRRVDGLPLAIELAAAWAPILPPAALLARLEPRLPLLTGGARDLPTRQQTMRDAIAWSHDLLAPGEQDLFRRLAVFAGGFGLEAVEAVAGAEEEGAEVLPGLFRGVAALVDKSLIGRGGGHDEAPRFRMLETVREFALERLEEGGEAEAVRRRHAAHYLALAEEAEPALWGPDPQQWLERLQAEHDNLRTALTWTTAGAEPEWGVRLAGALWPFWRLRFFPGEGRRWLERALARCGETPSLSRAKALLGVGTLAWAQSDYARAEPALAEAVCAYQALGDPVGTGRVRLALGRLCWDRGDFDRAAACCEEALDLFRGRDDGPWLAQGLHNLALVAQQRGEYDRAETLFAEALDRWRAAGFRWGLSCCVPGHVGDVARARGDLGRAVAQYQDGLVKCHEQADTENVCWILIGLATIAMAWRQPARAARLLGAAETLIGSLDAPLMPTERADFDRTAAAVRDLLGDAEFAVQVAAGRATQIDQVVAEAREIVPAAGNGRPSRSTERIDGQASLTARELEVLRLVVAGCTDRQIADALFLSPRTVHHHVANVMAKLGAANRAAAAKLALAGGLLVKEQSTSR